MPRIKIHILHLIYNNHRQLLPIIIFFLNTTILGALPEKDFWCVFGGKGAGITAYVPNGIVSEIMRPNLNKLTLYFCFLKDQSGNFPTPPHVYLFPVSSKTRFNSPYTRLSHFTGATGSNLPFFFCSIFRFSLKSCMASYHISITLYECQRVILRTELRKETVCTPKHAWIWLR